MHEYALARDLVDRAVLEAARQGGEKIYSMTIRLGDEPHLDREALSFNLRAAASDTPAAGAEFHLMPGTGRGTILESIELEEASDVSGSTGPSGTAN